MQRQKTVAKWLAIILLCTVAVGAYIMYDALYVGSGGKASAGSDGVPAQPDGQTPTSPEPDDNPPYYTTLPRAAQTVAGTEVGHVGGENDDAVQGAVFTADSTMLFFNSESDEYDCRGAGMYRAVFTEEGLVSVLRFADAGTLADVVLATEGVTAIVSSEGAGRLYLFGTDGTQKGETSFPDFRQAEIYVCGTSTQVFYTDGQGLRAAVVKQGLNVEISPYYYSPEEVVIKEIFAVGNRFLLFAQTAGGDCIVLSYTQNTGFNILKRFEKTSFMQVVPMAGEDGAAFAFLGATADGGTLAVLSADCSELAVTALPSPSDAVIFSDGVSLTLVRCGVTETYCRHLDLIASRPNALLFDDVLYVRNSTAGRLFAATRAEGFSVYGDTADNAFGELLFVPAADVGRLFAAVRGDSLAIAFSSSLSEGCCYQNFGKSDVFLLGLPLSP